MAIAIAILTAISAAASVAAVALLAFRLNHATRSGIVSEDHILRLKSILFYWFDPLSPKEIAEICGRRCFGLAPEGYCWDDGGARFHICVKTKAQSLPCFYGDAIIETRDALVLCSDKKIT